MGKKSILFVCTHNSARSQMAEGLVNHYHGDSYKAFSAGTIKTTVNPLAIRVLDELGIDISHHTSKTTDIFMDQFFDIVVTVCDNANETCPYFPHADTRIHKNFQDPSTVNGSAEQKLTAFKNIRDEIKSWLEITLN